MKTHGLGLLALTCWSLAQPIQSAPPNDALSSYTELPPSGPATAGSNVGATLEAGENIPPGFTTANYGATAWWGLELAASESVWYDIQTLGSTFDTVLAVWTGVSFADPLTLIHVNDEATEGGISRVRFLANPATIYKISVAGRGASQQGTVSIRALSGTPPFAQITAATLSPSSALDVGSAGGTITANLSIESTREIASGQWVLFNPGGAAVATAPFSGAANRVSGNVAQGAYQVSATVPQGSLAGTYRWSLRMVAATTGAVSSYGWEALTPLPSGAVKTFNVLNTAPDTYTLWATANSLTGTDSDPEDDFEKDSVPNLAEFAYNLNPVLPSLAKLIADANSITQLGLPYITTVGTGNQKRLRVEYARRIGDASLTYTVQFSNDLVTWTNSTQAATLLASNGTMQAVAVEDAVFTPARPRRFARVLIMR